MKAYALSPLIRSMKQKRIEMEHFSFSFKAKQFDCILVIKPQTYEILVGIHSDNWACILIMDSSLEVTMNDNDFFTLCNLLNLRPGAKTFTSFDFLLLLSKSAPKQTAGARMIAQHLRPFTIVSEVEDKDKIYFVSWMTHINDGRKARNIKKTEFYFGKRVADFCSRYNISSVWSANAGDGKPFTLPPGFDT